MSSGFIRGSSTAPVSPPRTAPRRRRWSTCCRRCGTRPPVTATDRHLASAGVDQDNRAVNQRALQSYLTRVGDRWPIEVALLGGARVADEKGAPPQRERGPEFVVVLVSSYYEGMPWLERV